VRTFLENYPLSEAKIMPTTFWRLVLYLSSGKKQGRRGNTYSVRPVKQSQSLLLGPITLLLCFFPEDEDRASLQNVVDVISVTDTG
jgi:hypothetical protein